MEFISVKERATSSSVGNYSIAVASFIFTILCGLFAIHRLNPPTAQSASAPVSEFASGRAMEHLKRIAKKPHPIGSAEHSAVKDYILKELSSLGLSPEVQRSLVLNRQRGGSYVAASVQNIIGRIEGIDSKQAVLLSCHYDSVPTGPGASDDGASVAALLEVIRSLKTSSPQKNDTLILFTDGEEVGMFGAKAFMDEHPYAKDVAVALNFEARGVNGPSIMFETSEGNEWLIRQFAEAAQRPVANSLTYDIYKLLPSDTDLTIFKNGGLRGLNFAYISGLSYYHTSRDSYENIDERSLQHQGSQALTLARHFAGVSNWPARASNAVYFDILSSVFVAYSERMVLPFMTFGLALFIGLVILGFRMKRLTLRGISFGIFGFLLNVICVVALLMITWQSMQSLSSNPLAANHNSNLYTVGFLALTIALTTTLFIWLRKKTRIENLIVGALFWWGVLMILVCLRVPGGSYLITWPFLFMLLAVGMVFFLNEAMTSTKSIIILTLPALSGVILIAPLMRLMTAGLGMQALWILMALAVFLLALQIAHLNLLISVENWRVPLASGLLGLCFVVAGILMNDVSINQPKLDHIFYALNADTGKAIWGSADQHPDEWTSQFFSSGAERASLAEHLPWVRGTFLKGDAPLLPLTPPSVVVLDDKRIDGLRTLRVRVTSPRRAPAMAIYWKRELELESLAVNGKRVVEENFDSARNPVGFRRFSYFGPSEEGIELSLEIKSSDPVELKVEDRSYGLPEIPDKPYKGRPDYIVASPFQYSDCTVVTKSVRF